MKKTLFIFVILCLCVCVSAQNLKNSRMSLSFVKGDKNNIFLTEIKDIERGVNFIKNTDGTQNIWSIKARADRDFGGEDIWLSSMHAEKFSSETNGNTVRFIWKNVKSDAMAEGFDVVCFVELKGENSYWDLEIKCPKSYGLSFVRYPIISEIDARDGDELMMSLRGNGMIYNQFSDPRGYEYHLSVPGKAKYRHDELSFGTPTGISMTSLTKGNSTLYISPEDRTWSMKDLDIMKPKPNSLEYSAIAFPENLCIGGKDYVQNYRHNIAIIKGDWYNAAKKYRKWGIDSRIPVFERGKIENRKDLPDWLKKNCVWMCWLIDNENGADSLIKSQKMLGVPCAVHAYFWNEFLFDVNFPEMLPAKKYFTDNIKKVQDAGMPVMPYMDGHLVDRNNSASYKKYGDELFVKQDKGDFYTEHWARDKGADNMIACIGSPFYDVIKKEFTDIMRETMTDAFYIDQIGASKQYACFNENHNHPIGGGNSYVKLYNKFNEELKKDISELRGQPVPLCTEDVAEFSNFDMWLRVNDAFAANTDTPLPNVIYSGYAVNIADNNEFMIHSKLIADREGRKLDYDPEDTMNEMSASALVSGTQIGWRCGSKYEFDAFPKYAKYLKNAAQARNSAYKYFNFGELMRAVKLENVPSKRIVWIQWNGKEYVYLPLVRTGTFYYNGKTMLCFTNVSEKNIEFSWKGKPEDMGLVTKSFYKLTEIYPKKDGNSVSLNRCGSDMKIGPFETKLYIIE